MWSASETQHLSDIITKSSHNSRILFSTINSIVNPSACCTTNSSQIICQEFKDFFINKIDSISSNISHPIKNFSLATENLPVLNNFHPVSFPLLGRIIAGTKPTSCQLDKIPTKLLKQSFAAVGPSILMIFNSSLATSTVPSCFKHAIVQPLLKRPGLDLAIPNNFRPISKLSFLSKVFRKD